MIIEVLIAERDPSNTLADHGDHRVFDPIRLAIVPKTSGQPLTNPRAPVYLWQQYCPAVRTDDSSVKSSDHCAPPQLLKFHLFCYTLCFHKAALLPWRNCLVTQLLCHKVRPYSFLFVRIQANTHSVVFSIAVLNFFFDLFFMLSANNRIDRKDAHIFEGTLKRLRQLTRVALPQRSGNFASKNVAGGIRSICPIDGRGSKVQQSVIHSHIITKREGCQEKPQHKIYHQQRQMPPLHSHSVE